MGRRSRTQITKELALKIVKKLKAENTTDPNAAHDEYTFFYEGEPIAIIGIRRGSRKNLGHDHVPKDMNVGTGFAKQFAHCHKSVKDFLEKRGVLPNEE